VAHGAKGRAGELHFAQRVAEINAALLEAVNELREEMAEAREEMAQAIAEQAARQPISHVCETRKEAEAYAEAVYKALNGHELRVYWAAKLAAATEFDAVINASVSEREYDSAAYERLCREWAIRVCALFDNSPPYSEGHFITARDYPPVIDIAFARKGGE